MGTVIDRLDIARGGWRDRHRASHLAVAAAKTCLHRAGRAPGDVDLLIMRESTGTGIWASLPWPR
jgi:3-oxoacyl-[acyl-carrier-protein] synthase-3